MFEAFDNLYPRHRYRALQAATEAGRDYLLGSDILALIASCRVAHRAAIRRKSSPGACPRRDRFPPS